MTRIKDGRVYTPPVLARLAASRLLHYANLTRVGHPRTVYDPCCGDGALLHACEVVGFSRTGLIGVDIDAAAAQQCAQHGYPSLQGDLFDYGTLSTDSLLICNPPYVGQKNLRRVVGETRYLGLKQAYPADRAGTCDLAGYVLRHICQVLRPAVSVWIATNTIAQGSTRRVGLQWALANGYRIVGAYKDIVWPGEAEVVVHVLVLVDTRWCRVPAKEIEYVPNYKL